MEEMNLNNELESLENEGASEETSVTSTENESYGDYEPKHEIENVEDDEDDENGDLGYLVAMGLVAGGAVLGAWAWPKIKKGANNAKNWIKSKIDKKDSEENVIDAEVVESK